MLIGMIFCNLQLFDEKIFQYVKKPYAHIIHEPSIANLSCKVKNSQYNEDNSMTQIKSSFAIEQHG